MLRTILLLALIASPLAATAEPVSGKNYYVREGKGWPTGEKTGYWQVKQSGISTSDTGPLGTEKVECHGGGFWGPEGATGEGMCIFGEGDDTRTLTWDHKGTGGTWEIVHGTGKWAGVTGSGTYENTRLGAERTLNSWEGQITLP